ncbi:uncharacterized protein FSUBG_11138 [Fusarium subglutinans]|uniref:Uncharacterized protein n=1 Tax=Gibberella subglutinans TaxID=42677 RepID=A0A8H5LD54_GIBSU|nr:uncharacterized protein FSUBG_11138 [Fusarium subglutinans]KAF5589483.1 hypothetical protein FSUBG_11138 [Fusarium subglutinans]
MSSGEPDIEARKGTTQRDLKEFHHSKEIFNIPSSSGEFQPQSLKKTEPSPTTEKVSSLGSLADSKTAPEETPQLCLVEDILQGLSELKENKENKEIAEEKANKFTKKVMNMEHRFSLRPYRKDLTPAEFRQDWIQKLMNPWMEDCDDAHAFLIYAKRRIADADRFQRII